MGNQFKLEKGWFVDTEYKYSETEKYAIIDGDGDLGKLDGLKKHSVIFYVGKDF